MRMGYYAKVRKEESGVTIGGLDEKIRNEIYAYKSVREMRKVLDEEFWPNGWNLIRIPAKQVYEQFYYMHIDEETGLVTEAEFYEE